MPVYLKYGTIKGGVTEPAHRSWIDLTNIQMGKGMPSLSLASAQLSPAVTEITVTKVTDQTSTQLAQASSQGIAANATIDLVKDGTVSLRVEMSNAMIDSWHVSSSHGSGLSTESLTLNFTTIKLTQNPGTPPP